MKSLKISSVHNDPNELLKRLRGVKAIIPGKRKLVQDIKDSNWEAVYGELLYRIELYASNSVVNYTRRDLAELVIIIAKHKPAVVASALYTKNFGIDVRSEFDIIGGDVRDANFSGSQLSKLISDLMTSNKKTVTFMYVDEDSIISPEEAGVDDGSIIMLLNDDPTSNVFSFGIDLRDDAVTKKSLLDELSKINDVDFIFDEDGGLSVISGDEVQLDADDDLTFDENFPEVSKSDVNAIVKRCTDELIPIINEAVANGEFELQELFKMNPAIDDTNFNAVNARGFVIDEMEKFDFDPNFEDSELFDYLYDLVEDMTMMMIFPILKSEKHIY